jgi:dTDP-glucose 4,6-dehydratase
MNVLITGAAGFIGSNFVHYWLESHPKDKVIALDALTYAGNMDNLSDVINKIEFVKGDICDLAGCEEVMRKFEINLVVNFAAESHNSLAIIDPGRFFKTNVLGTQSLCEAAKRVGVQRFHHISTCEVYGDLPLDSDEKFSETSPYRPRTPYNASKAGGDHAVRAYHETFDLNITITNCSNNYGPYQFPEKVIPVFITKALNNQPLPLYASVKNMREWLHVKDHCIAIDKVISDGKIGETYHVGSGVEKSIEEIADAVLKALGKPDHPRETVPDRPGHDRRYLLDTTKIETELGFSPTITFEDGLRSTVRWYVENRSWWEPLLNRRPLDESSAWK